MPTVLVAIDPTRVDSAGIALWLPGFLAHGLHHAARWIKPGYGTTLLEALVTEGLADHFSCELLDTPIPPWANLSAVHLRQALNQAHAEIHSRSYSHEDWFFGCDGRDIPRWTGYTLGWMVVDRWQKSPDGRSAEAAVTEPADSFRSTWSELVNEVVSQRDGGTSSAASG